MLELVLHVLVSRGLRERKRRAPPVTPIEHHLKMHLEKCKPSGIPVIIPPIPHRYPRETPPTNRGSL